MCTMQIIQYILTKSGKQRRCFLRPFHILTSFSCSNDAVPVPCVYIYIATYKAKANFKY